MNEEWRMIWKEVVVAYFRYCPSLLLECWKY